MDFLLSNPTSLISNASLSLTTVAIATLSDTVMYSFTSLFVIGALAVQTVLGFPSLQAFKDKRHSEIVKRTVDSFLTTEEPYALNEILCALGSAGCNARGVASGLVLASPDQTAPTDYFFHWTRDGALAFKCIVDTFINTAYNPTLQAAIETYIIGQAKLQTVSNPSGSLSDGTGLGEPKFNPDGTAFTGAWGRPQRDGPALRATTLIAYSRWLIANGYASTAQSVVWPIIQNDLNYVGQYWNQSGFDLWEEIDGSSFFTVAQQHRALVEGNTLAEELGFSCPGCVSQAPQILCFLQSFWSASEGYTISNINTNDGRSGKDANTIIGSIQSFDPLGNCDDTTFQPCSERALANHKVVTDAFRSIYTVNSGLAEGVADAVGRYPEDTYQGGNPWFLITEAAAELLYDALYQWNRIGSLTVSTISLPFFKDFDSSIATGTYASSTTQYTTLTTAIRTYADGFLNIVASHALTNGSLSEQYSRSNGEQLSAYDLTWSYAALLTAAARRSGVVPASWGEASNAALPASCAGSSAQGSYTTATNTVFPTSQTSISNTITATIPPLPTTTSTSGSGTGTSTSCTLPTSIAVTFNEIVTTTFGETIKIAGSDATLGEWDTDNAIPLSAIDYTASDNLWFVEIGLQPGEVVQYKFINVATNGDVTWEADPNHTLTVPAASCQETGISVDSNWQF